MKKNIRDKRIIFIYVIAIFTLIFGVTYALQSTSLSLGFTTALIGIDESAYGSTTFDTSNLDFRPILDSEVETSENEVVKIDFQVGGARTNNNDHIIYDIALNNLKVECALLSPYIKWKLIKNGTEISNGSLDYKFDTIVGDVENGGRLVLTTIQQDLPDYNVNKTGYDSYTFYMWFSDSCQSSDLSTCISDGTLYDQQALLGKDFSGKIEVELYTEGKKELIRNPETTLTNSVCLDKFTVNFNTNGGVSPTKSKKVIKGLTYGTLPIPTKSFGVIFNTNGGSSNDQLNVALDFGGWYLEYNYTTLVTESTVVNTNSNHTLYARWFNSNNTITLPSTSRTGYSFEGWYSDQGLSNKVGDAGDSYSVTSDTVLHAKWSPLQYAIYYFDRDDQTSASGTPVYYDSTVPNHAVPSRASVTVTFNNPYYNSSLTANTATLTYTFQGYYTGKNGTGTKYNDSNGAGLVKFTQTSSVNLYAYWTSRPITLPTLKMNRKNYSASSTTTTSLSGVKWVTSLGGTTSVGTSGSSYTPTENITLYARIGTQSLINVSQGSYIKYTGNNGCTNCTGANSSGDCSRLKYKYSGWRLAYYNNSYPSLISGGGVLCIASKSASIFIKSLKQGAMKYCNKDYIYGGSCITATSVADTDTYDYARPMINADLKYIVGGPTIASCASTSTSSASCGAKNELINVGANYWAINSMSNNNTIYYWRSTSKSFTSYSSSKIVYYGTRVLLKLRGGINVTGGYGTASDPYTIS